MPKVNTLFWKMGGLIAVTALVGIFASIRFKHAGAWLPPVPNQVAYWEATDTPVSDVTLSILGYPQALGREYSNPLGEQVEMSLVAAGPFENYHDPTVCVAANGFQLSARKNLVLPGTQGNGRIRAMIFKRDNTRILMYYWQQNSDGGIETEPVMGNYRDIIARFQTGVDAVIRGHQVCLIRNYTLIPPEDVTGVQSERNLTQISLATYKALLESGTPEAQRMAKSVKPWTITEASAR